MKQKKISTENYKGTRDFFPEMMDIRNWMFSGMRKVVTSFGYREYDGPMLEFMELYRAKSGEEIVDRQLYNFLDKGGREVAIRPEMTPTLARMVAIKNRELPRPIRWFSIPNLWRYEAPGHGRLREHWQLNVDLFGENSYRAELEIIRIAAGILIHFGAGVKDFKIRISNRKIMNYFFTEILKISDEVSVTISKLLDKRNKIQASEFHILLSEKLDQSQIDKVNQFLNSSLDDLKKNGFAESSVLEECEELLDSLKSYNLGDSIVFDPSIVRGFDYYTGFIFEIFDTNPENKRSLYGGGRYDNLIGLFSSDELSGTGFGLGDVTLLNFLTTHNLLPKTDSFKKIYIGLLNNQDFLQSSLLADEIRKVGVICEVNLDGKAKLGKQIQCAEKKGYSYFAIYGENEVKRGVVSIKNLLKGSQEEVPLQNLGLFLQAI